MARFFMAGTNLPGSPTAILYGRDAEHIRVLRIRPGEEVTICDTKGTDYKCRLVRADREEAELEVLEVTPCRGEPNVAVTEALADAQLGIESTATDVDCAFGVERVSPSDAVQWNATSSARQ